MAIAVFPEYRIKRAKSTADAMKKLIDYKIFNRYKDIIMISAIIGYNENRYVEIDKFAEPVLMTFFKQRDYDLMDLIAFAYKKDPELLHSEKKYKIFESFANGGFPILLRKLGLEDIESRESFSPEEVKTLQKKYYTLLISDSFIPKDISVTDDDLFIS